MALDTSRYRIAPDRKIQLADFDPEDEPGARRGVEKQFEKDVEDIVELHSRLGAEEVDSMLIDLLAFDTGGKDETLNGVFNRLPIQSIQVEKFSEPSKEALAHDFLWRVHIQAPRRGEIVVFNRSYYDDVTEPRVTGEIDLDRCEQRYEHIRTFESLLMDEASTTILKFYFHISRDEQARRIEERLEDPERQWDFDPHDIQTQRQWDGSQPPSKMRSTRRRPRVPRGMLSRRARSGRATRSSPASSSKRWSRSIRNIPIHRMTSKSGSASLMRSGGLEGSTVALP